MKRAIVLITSLFPLLAFGQCVQIRNTGQIICPAYANSTPPMWNGGGYYTYQYPGRAAAGAAQVIAGGVGIAGAVLSRQSNQLPYYTGNVVRGYETYRSSGPTYVPQRIYPVPRPYGYPY